MIARDEQSEQSGFCLSSEMFNNGYVKKMSCLKRNDLFQTFTMNHIARDAAGNPSTNVINNTNCAGCVKRLVYDGPATWHYDFLHWGDPMRRGVCQRNMVVWMTCFYIRTACENCMKMLFTVVSVMLNNAD